MENKKSYAKVFFCVFLCLFLIALEFEYIKKIGTKKIMVKEYSVTSKKISEEFDSFKIVHISDIHYGTTIDKSILTNMVKKINYINPDLVILSGDLLEKNSKFSEEELTNVLKKINAKIGKYAVSGDQDYKNSLWQNILSNSDFTIIDDTYELIYKESYDPIILSGISTNIVNKNNITEKISSSADFISKNENLFSILVLHEPDYVDQLNLDSYDMILSGHSHNGYINVPWVKNFLLEEGSQKYYENYYKLNNTKLFISNGIGTSDFNYRFLNRPSINFYRLYSKN